MIEQKFVVFDKYRYKTRRCIDFLITRGSPEGVETTLVYISCLFTISQCTSRIARDRSALSFSVYYYRQS